jgi:sterol desaturase/sphingolipid hydroxylase (fatty acid hydroxylase superfamily)
MNAAPHVLALLVDPFVQFLFAGSILWWPYLLIAATVALFAFWRSHGTGRAALGAFGRRCCGRALWAHPSARADYAYYIVNSMLHPLLVAPLIISGAAVAAGVEHGLAALFGSPGAALMGVGMARALYTVAFFIVYDFARYLGHSLLHDSKLLWQFHKLHHSAEVLTPITNYRAHPVELLVMGAIPNAATGIISGLVWYLMAGQIGYFSFLGLHAGVAAFNALANLRHFPVWVSFGPVLDRWLISPAHHHLHHSSAAAHFGKNRGFALALWDRLFGTLLVPAAEEPLRFGLGDGSDGAWTGVARMYGWPFRDAFALVACRGRGLAQRLWRDRRANYSMIVVLLLPVITGFVAMGSEAGLWFYTHQTMQGAADAAAFSAARVAISGGQWPVEALAVAASHGFANGTSATTVLALSPPQAGSHIGIAGYYEVFISQQQKRLFSALLIGTPVTITARAVATISGTSGADGCLVALDKSVVGAISASGGAQLNLANCDLYDDSAATGTNTKAALILTGGAGITATAGYIVGSADATSLDFHGTLYASGALPLADPFAATAVPTPSGCAGGTSLTFSGGSQHTLSPGTYCNGITVSGASEIDLNPGVYVLNQGTFAISGGSSLWCPPKADWSTGTPPTAPASDGGCTIVLSSSLVASNPASCAGLTISGGAVINLNPPTSGATQGFALMSAQSCAVGKVATLSGGSTQNITGTIYLPTYSVSYSGGAATGSGTTSCTQLIADTISFTGGSGLGNNCSTHAGQYQAFGNAAILAE